MPPERDSATDLGWDYLWHDANVAVLRLSRDGVITSASPYAHSLIGRPLSGLHLSEVVVDFDPDAAPERWWQPTATPRLTNIETASGIPQTVYVTVRELSDGLLWLGQIDGAEQEVLRTELLSLNSKFGQLSRELARKNADLSQANALKNQFLGMAAHDLRNPVHLVLNYAELMEEDSTNVLAPEHATIVERIRLASERMARMIDSFLDVSLIDAGRFPLELTRLDPALLIQEARQSVAPIALKREIAVVARIEDGLSPHLGDQPKLIEVVVNLLNNAIEHSSLGGSVIVECRGRGDALLFSVTDHGCGMDAEARSKLFRAFSGSLARKADGTRSIGLGLTIAQKIVAAHGGEMFVESELGVGSTLGFTLPSVDASSIGTAGL